MSIWFGMICYMAGIITSGGLALYWIMIDDLEKAKKKRG